MFSCLLEWQHFRHTCNHTAGQKNKLVLAMPLRTTTANQHITETRPHRAQQVRKSAEETNKTTKTQWWRQGEMKNGGKERQSLAHKNPAVRRCEAEPQARWHREKEVTCGADEVRMKKKRHRGSWGEMWKMRKMTNMLLCNTSILSTMNTELRAEE